METTIAHPSKGVIESLADIVTEGLPLYRDRTVVRYDDGVAYRSINAPEYLKNIYRMIDFFGKHSPGQHVVSTLMKNRPEWDMTAFASMYTANILSPLDTQMNDHELRHLLRSNPPDFIVVSVRHRARLHGLLEELGLEPSVLVADQYPVFEDIGAFAPCERYAHETLMSRLQPASTLRASPSPLLDDENTVLARYATSGTTSLPKVVSITHKNILFQLNEALGMINLRKNEDVLSIGAYTHIATLLEFLVAKTKRFTVSYFTREAEDDGVLEDEIKKLKRQGVRIRCLMAVPKFWNFVLKEVLEEMNNKPVFRTLYHHLTSIEKSDHFYDIGTLDKAKLVAARTLLRNKLGGYFAYGISSSTKIEPGVIDIFAKLGITVIDVYGATETSGVIAKNELNLNRRGFCGRLLDGFEFKLKDVEWIPGVSHPVGELYLKGSGVAFGYLNPADEFAIDSDGFFATGDIAFVDNERWVFLVGRKKELIHWEDGQYTDPMHVSNLLIRSIWIKDGLVIRQGNDDFLSAFVFPDYARLRASERYKEGLKKGSQPDQILRPLLEEAIRYAQSLLGEFPKISTEKIYILPRKLERTPTHKIKLISELEKLDFDRFI